MSSAGRTRLGGQVRKQHCRLDFDVQLGKPSLNVEREPSWSLLPQSVTCV